MNQAITNYLAKLEHKRFGNLIFASYAITASFSTYFCMYAFRKPYTVATFQDAADVSLWFLPALDYKILLVITQLIGYTASKFYGVKFVSEIQAGGRARAIIILIGLAQLALLGFAMVPNPWNTVFLLLNGFPLGMVWGLVFGYLEGRQLSEVLGAGLSASFILASGFVKSIGSWILQSGFSEYWMPFLTGLCFLPLLVLFTYLLSLLPPPSRRDEELRTKRQPMYATERNLFLRRYAPGLVFYVILYMLLTAYRDFRDNFAAELWGALGYGQNPAIFTWSELPITIGVLIILGSMYLFRNNKRAFYVINVIMMIGAGLIGVATVFWQLGWISGLSWMILVGLGLYMAYVPYGCILFERMIAVLGFAGTAGFLIYVADSVGYFGSVMVLLYKNFGYSLGSAARGHAEWLKFFTSFSYITSSISLICFLVALYWFHGVFQKKSSAQKE